MRFKYPKDATLQEKVELRTLLKDSVVPELGPCYTVEGFQKGRRPTIARGNKQIHMARIVLGIEDDPELWALHHCDNEACIRKEHLYAGTPSDNIRDAYKRGRQPYAGEGKSESSRRRLKEKADRKLKV